MSSACRSMTHRVDVVREEALALNRVCGADYSSVLTVVPITEKTRVSGARCATCVAHTHAVAPVRQRAGVRSHWVERAQWFAPVLQTIEWRKRREESPRRIARAHRRARDERICDRYTFDECRGRIVACVDGALRRRRVRSYTIASLRRGVPHPIILAYLVVAAQMAVSGVVAGVWTDARSRKR